MQRLKDKETLKIACLGTSLSAGNSSWFAVMEEWLVEQYGEHAEFYNYAIAASASSVPNETCGLVQCDKLNVIRPDVVFIEFGINDAYGPYYISLEDSRDNLEKMIGRLKSSNPEVEIILQTMNVVIDMPELNMSEATKRPALTDYYDGYRQVAADMGLLLIDHYPNWRNLFESKGREVFIKYVPDGIHPKYEGYRKILLPELQKSLTP
jgi:alpha-L-rhamnosidase/acyl-CoA thioesterase-1